MHKPSVRRLGTCCHQTFQIIYVHIYTYMYLLYICLYMSTFMLFIYIYTQTFILYIYKYICIYSINFYNICTYMSRVHLQLLSAAASVFSADTQSQFSHLSIFLWSDHRRTRGHSLNLDLSGPKCSPPFSRRTQNFNFHVVCSTCGQ